MADIFYEAVQFTPGNLGISFNIDSLNLAAIFDDAAEHFEFRRPDEVSNIRKFHIETKIRFIRTIILHGIVPGNPVNGQLDFMAQDSLEDIVHHLFRKLLDIFLAHEGHFHVELGEFRLAVSTQIFISEAFSNLEIAVHAGNHEQLLE